MKQVIQNYRTGELKVEELPPPALRAGGVLVQTAYSLISSGTERSTLETAQSSLLGKARSRPDLVKQVFDTFKREGLRSTYDKVRARLNEVKALGYSASGVVIEADGSVEELQAGDRVACAGAGYASHAEVIFVPANLCCKVPESASLVAASYTTVGAIALQGIRQAEVALAEVTAVIGLGLVGQLTVQLLKAAGCRVLGIDINPAACELAKLSGADMVAGDEPSAKALCNMLTHGRGADFILITASSKSNQPVELAAELARDRARVVVVGLVRLDLPRSVFYAKELDLRLSRSYGPGRYDPSYEEKGNDYPIGYVRWTEKRNMEAFLRLVAEKKINTDILTTHRFAVADAPRAYDLILNRTGEGYCGVVLEYGAGPQATVVPQHRRSVASVASDEVGVSFLGAGNFARGVLLPVMKRNPKTRLVGVSAASGVSARNAAEQFGFAYSTTRCEELFEDPSAQCVFIATRHNLHAGFAAEALRRGKAVFVEKPLALTAEELSQVVTAAHQTGGCLMAGYNRRFAPLAKDVKDHLAARTGPMTILYRINAGQLPQSHWSLDPTEGGGRVVGEVCHFIDFVQFLTDSLPVRVSATTVSNSRTAGFADDSVSASIKMADGSVASIVYAASGDPSVSKEKVEVFCDRSIAIIDDFKTGEVVRGSRKINLGSKNQDKGHATEIEIFLNAVRRGDEAPIALESLVATSLASFAINDCARSGAVVRIDSASWITSQLAILGA